MAPLSFGSAPLAAPSAHSIRAAVKMASGGLYGAPLRFLPWCTPRAWDRPLFDSIVPMPASTSQVRPRQVRAACTYQVR